MSRIASDLHDLMLTVGFHDSLDPNCISLPNRFHVVSSRRIRVSLDGSGQHLGCDFSYHLRCDGNALELPILSCESFRSPLYD